jgi:hypothetical protein
MEKGRLYTSALILGLLLVLVAGLTVRASHLHRAQAPPKGGGAHDAAPGQEPGARAAHPRAVTDAPPDTFTGTHVEIHYYDSALHPSEPVTTCISSTQAQLLAQQLDDAWDAFVNYGFHDPDSGGAARLPVWVFSPLDQDAWGWSRGSHIEIDPVRVQANAADTHKGTPHHELFHQVQITYGADEPDWVDEGTAKFIEDMVFNDLDADAASAFVGRVNKYLGNPNRTLWDKATSSAVPGGLLDTSYNATLIWKYLTEQYGDTSDPYFGAEPQYGIDWLVDFWEQETRTGVDAVNAALPAGVNFVQVFENFLITSYVKHFTVSDAYCYVDDPGPAYAYHVPRQPALPVRVEYGTENLPLSHASERVEDWGANYYVGRPGGTCPFVQVTLDGDPGSQAFYAIFATRGNDAFYYDHLGFRTFANDFTKTLHNDSYDAVVAVVGGLHNPAEYSVSMSCVSPALNIVEPRQDLFAEVGDPDQPRRMMVYVEITGSGGSGFVEGVTWEDFEVSVGGRPVDDVVTGAYVQSQYWLIVQPPTQTVSGDPPWPFDLDVTLEGLSDHEDDAVHYRPLPHYDEVLVIDTSGSMDSPAGYPKLLAAKNAAKLYVDELADGDKMGAVQFETVAERLWQGMATVNDLNRWAARLLIDDLSSGNCTSIGGGLLKALDQFNDTTYPGDPDNPDVIILLSDGMENTSPCWEYHPPSSCPDPPYHDCSTGPYVHDQVVDSDVPVHTVALGPGSHEDLMERIAEETGGRYRFATLPSTLATTAVVERPAAPGLEPPLGTRSPTAPQQNEWAYQLSGIYDFFEGEVEGRERILVQEVTIPDDAGGWYETRVYLDETVSHATFSIAYEEGSELDGSCGPVRRVELRPPSGTPHDPTRSTNYHDLFEISSPLPGTWVVRVEMYDTPCRAPEGPAEVQAPATAPYHYQVMVSGQTGLATEVRVGTPHEERFIGLCVPIFATFLGESGPVRSGAVTANVTTPGGGQISMSLLDNGNQGDGAPDDGIYGGRFCRGSAAGSYTVEVQGRIEAMAGTIRRLATASFYVQDDDDDDGDGMPNRWEQLHGLNPALADDAGNPDLDFGCIFGCAAWTNAHELEYGTDPHDDDTDGGGEMDYSELLHGQDPTSGPEDDGVDIPTSFRVTPGNGENTITHDVRPGDDTYWLFWSADAAMEDLLDHRVDIGVTGTYTHTGLTNGTAYYYRLVALRDGHISGFADQASATPAIDPTPPEGNILINGDAQRAFSFAVTLSLYASDDTTEMLIANTPDFTGASWEPFATTRAWYITPGPDEALFVFVRFRDGAGNVSEIAVDGILAPRMLYLPVVTRDYGGP